jgi:hypothetical protein
MAAGHEAVEAVTEMAQWPISAAKVSEGRVNLAHDRRNARCVVSILHKGIRTFGWSFQF